MTEMFLFLMLSPIENEEERRILTELYQKYRKRVEIYIRTRFTMSTDDIEDCVQQSYLNVARNIAKVATLASNCQVAYLMRTAYTVVLNFLEGKKKIVFVDTEEDKLEQVIYAHAHRSVPNAEEVVENWEILHRFQERLSELTPTEQVVFQLYLIEGITREDLAKQLGVSINSVRTYISRTKAHAQEILKEVYYEQ